MSESTVDAVAVDRQTNGIVTFVSHTRNAIHSPSPRRCSLHAANTQRTKQCTHNEPFAAAVRQFLSIYVRWMVTRTATTAIESFFFRFFCPPSSSLAFFFWKSFYGRCANARTAKLTLFAESLTDNWQLSERRLPAIAYDLQASRLRLFTHTLKCNRKCVSVLYNCDSISSAFTFRSSLSSSFTSSSSSSLPRSFKQFRLLSLIRILRM